ncbi:MAG: TRAP transporter large permease subunit, partial [Deltaproteobacteria bacterium]|nr:TRAP transporter large permease subunit [Deltaproteobacteria bacterium]
MILDWFYDTLPLWMFAALFVFLMLGYPVAFSIGGVAMAFGFLYLGLDDFNLLPGRIFDIIQKSILLAVPLFIFMGVTLERAGIAEDLLETMSLLLGRIKGGLALSVVLVGALLAASTGIVG